DTPSGIDGATALAAAIADAMRDIARKVLQIADVRLPGLARLPEPTPPPERPAPQAAAAAPRRPRGRKLASAVAAGAVVAVLVLPAPVPDPASRHDVVSAARAPATYLVE